MDERKGGRGYSPLVLLLDVVLFGEVYQVYARFGRQEQISIEDFDLKKWNILLQR